MPSSQISPLTIGIDNKSGVSANGHLDSERTTIRIIEGLKKNASMSKYVSESNDFVKTGRSAVEQAKAAITNRQVARTETRQDSVSNKTIFGDRVYIFPTKSVGIELEAVPKPQALSLQELRDEVRMMVAAGKPSMVIPSYKGYKQNGDPIGFLLEHYSQYLPKSDTHTLFLHDLRGIDPRLTTAIDNIRRTGKPIPIGTKSDLINALAQGKFLDGAMSKRRVHNAMSQRKERST
jgi:hypothetical protein